MRRGPLRAASVLLLAVALTVSLSTTATTATATTATATTAATAAAHAAAHPAAPQAPAKTTLSGTVAGPVTCASAGTAFRDVPVRSAHCDDIVWMVGAGIDWGGAKFRPNKAVTRGALATLLYRLDRPNTALPTCRVRPLRDVSRGNRNCGPIAWATAAAIMAPVDGHRFRPAAPVTRAELADALYRFARRHAANPAATPRCTHTVGVKHSNPFCGVIAWASRNKITPIPATKRFRPNAIVGRAELAATAHRLVARTDAAPNLLPDVLSALAGAGIYATSVADPRRVHRGRSTKSGQFALTVPPGDYRICVDGSGVKNGARAGYRDACAGGVTWRFDQPTAPKTAAVISAPAANLLIVLPRLNRAAKHRRGVTPPVAKKSHSYTFVSDSIPPAGYSPCEPINVVVNFAGAPAGSDVLVATALSRVAAASGLRFIYEGTSTEAAAGSRWDYLPDRYGKRWAPVLIGWSTPHAVPDLVGSVIGVGGSMWRYGRTPAGRMAITYTSGLITLDGPQFADFAAQSTWDGTAGTLDGPAGLLLAVITHELGHVVGLGHVDDRHQLMNPAAGYRVTFGHGDLTALNILGNRTCATVALPN